MTNKCVLKMTVWQLMWTKEFERKKQKQCLLGCSAIEKKLKDFDQIVSETVKQPPVQMSTDVV